MPERALPPDTLTGLSLAEIADAAAARRLPPVDSWNPAHCGDSGMQILADGTWLHDGSAITRPAMVRLFSTLLRREEDGCYVLVTPVEKLSITVEDAPFAAVELVSEGAGRDRRLAFRLNTGDVVIAGPAHPVSMEEGRPLLHVRARLTARLARPVYYELAELALAEGNSPGGLWSDGGFLSLEEA
ncbi:DUF1285 domain-containing protein [uncultured Sphingomonas sp.]|uniref:DUF1285 domain-containing protein n=1 Tax=uncultured Sphingomonas sp. TaxID=158754 RepID=UPI0025F86B62|nr:DUF1285 domain-containing protein [uncultured Sphingomonas sp.]